jgi:D-serine dehydratase
MKNYKERLDKLNSKAHDMFEHTKEISGLINKKVIEIEQSVQKSEQNFTEKLTKLITLND